MYIYVVQRHFHLHRRARTNARTNGLTDGRAGGRTHSKMTQSTLLPMSRTHAYNQLLGAIPAVGDPLQDGAPAGPRLSSRGRQAHIVRPEAPDDVPVSSRGRVRMQRQMQPLCDGFQHLSAVLHDDDWVIGRYGAATHLPPSFSLPSLSSAWWALLSIASASPD